MKKFREDPYPNPIDVKRHPELEDLDEDLRRSAIGLPTKRYFKDDDQFLSKMDEWLDKETKKQMSRPKSFNHYYVAMRDETKQRRYEDENYEAEQWRLEQKWIQHNLQYK